jgi:hypothetical protein
MDNFRETAFSLTAWYAFLAFLGALLLIVLNDIETPAAFLIAANVALLFALGLIAKARGGGRDRAVPPGLRRPRDKRVRLGGCAEVVRAARRELISACCR